MGAGVSGILDVEPSNGKSSLFQRSSERERKEEREKRGGEREREERGERDTSASPIPGFQHQKMKAIVLLLLLSRFSRVRLCATP